MKTLIIGGNRFFGKRLAESLADGGHEVTLLNRGNIDDKLGPAVKRLEADRRNSAALRSALGDESWDVVFDQVCFNAAEAEAACEIFSGRAGRYVFTSTQSVYGPGPALKESAFDPYKHSFDPSSEFDYGEGKRRAEAVFFRQKKMPVVAARFPMVTGIDDPTGRLVFHLERVFEEAPIFFPAIEARLSLIQSADAARALAFLAERNFSGPINVAAAIPLRMRDFVNLLETKLGRSAKLLDKGGEAEHSPYGISEDWFMDTSRLNAMGFWAEEIVDWLPGLMEELASSLSS